MLGKLIRNPGTQAPSLARLILFVFGFRGLALRLLLIASLVLPAGSRSLNLSLLKSTLGFLRHRRQGSG